MIVIIGHARDQSDFPPEIFAYDLFRFRPRSPNDADGLSIELFVEEGRRHTCKNNPSPLPSKRTWTPRAANSYKEVILVDGSTKPPAPIIVIFRLTWINVIHPARGILPRDKGPYSHE